MRQLLVSLRAGEQNLITAWSAYNTFWFSEQGPTPFVSRVVGAQRIPHSISCVLITFCSATIYTTTEGHETGVRTQAGVIAGFFHVYLPRAIFQRCSAALKDSRSKVCVCVCVTFIAFMPKNEYQHLDLYTHQKHFGIAVQCSQVWVCILVCVYVCTDLCVFVWVYIKVCVYVCTHKNTQLCAHINTHVYVHPHTNTHRSVRA